MKKIILTLLAVTLLTACESSLKNVSKGAGNAVLGVSSIEELCLNGVSYYFYFRGNKVGMAVNINKDTLNPELCELKEK